MRTRIVAGAIALALLASACREEVPEQVPEAVDARDQNEAVGGPTQEQLVQAASQVVAFLRGEASLDSALLADTVALHIAPEGGGAVRKVARRVLHDRGGWMVDDYSMVPPATATTLTTRVGQHLNCREFPLATRFEELAPLPHVGTKLEPPGADSCLQSWNLTLVFDPASPQPRVVAAVYDQWEW